MEKLGVKSAKHLSAPNGGVYYLSAFLEPLKYGGSVFGLVHILGRKDEKRATLLHIIEDHLHTLIEQTDKEANAVRRFEQTLQAINDEIARYIKKGVNIPLTDLHAVLGVVFEKEIYLSGIGDLSAIFMHQTAKSRYTIYELDKQFASEGQSFEKPFITVLDGELHQGDVLYIATRLSSHEIGLSELQDVLVTLPPSGALKRIQQYAGPNRDYGAIAFKVMNREAGGPPKKVNPISSIEYLGKTKETTAELLGEQSPDIGSFITRFTKPILKKLSAPGTKGPKRIATYSLRLFVKAIAGLLAFLLHLLRYGGKLCVQLYRRLKKREKAEKGTEPKITSASKNHFAFFIRGYKALKQLPLSSKLIATGSIFVLLLILGSVSYLNTRTSEVDTEEAFTAITTRIQERKDAAEAALIYKDTVQARTLLQEASALLGTLPATTNAQKQIADGLRDDINRILFAMRGITEPEIVEIARIENDSLTAAVEANGSIYGLGAKNILYRLNTLESKVEMQEMANTNIAPALEATGEGSNILFIDQNRRLIRIDTATNTVKILTSGVDKLDSPADLTLYNGSLYLLNTNTEQIIRMRPQADGFEAGTAWINSSLTKLNGMVSLTIDGDIYALTPNAVKRFASGRELAYETSEVDPPLLGAGEIWTSIDTKYLYILDPAEGRIIVFEKSGAFVTQYVKEELKGAVGMIIREQEKKMYVVTPQRFIQFSASHLLQ